MGNESAPLDENADKRRRVSVQEALAKLPPGERGERFFTLFKHGSLELEIYGPRGFDPQKPHTRDEVYVVIQGQGEYVCQGERQRFEAGDFLFAAAGDSHWFERFSDDFAVWVLFYGPEAGEGHDAGI